jgi:2-(1,2-epoxy-1,2-dihydrophenyl)acetyl-CoA isomerase
MRRGVRKFGGGAVGNLPAMTPFLAVVDDGPIRTVVLNQPERRNAITRSGFDELAAAFDAFEASPQRVLVVRGAGEHFCAGADLAVDLGPESGRLSAAETHEWMQAPARAALRLHRISKPTIAAVDGVAVGAGMNLALGCDIVVATTRARFSEIFVRRGLALDFGGTWLLPRLIGLARARDLALTGRIVPADEALDIGLIGRVVEPDRLDAGVAELADELAAGAPLAQRFIKAELDRSSSMTFEQSLAFEDQAQAMLLVSDDFREGVAAFLDKRDAHFTGH